MTLVLDVNVAVRACMTANGFTAFGDHQLGLARTYDAEYLALAQILGCRLVTVDAHLRRGADRLGFVITPTEL